MNFKISILAGFIFLQGCVSVTLSQRGHLYEKVIHGSTLDEVKSILGPPVEVSSPFPNELVLTYSEDMFDNDDIYCQDGLLSFTRASEKEDYALASHQWVASSINQRCGGYANYKNKQNQEANRQIQEGINKMYERPKERTPTSTNCRPTYGGGFECTSK